jgi:uroporphyrinogen decarboxylase
MAVMTSRQRVVAAANHQEPDRVPVDIGGGSSTSISIEGYENLKRHLGVSGRPKTMSRLFRVAQLDECVMERLGSDCWPLRGKSPANWTPPPREPGTTVDIWGVTWKRVFRSDGDYYWEIVHCPLAEAGWRILRLIPGGSTDPGLTAGLAGRKPISFEGTTYAIEASGGCLVLGAGNVPAIYAQLVMDLALNGIRDGSMSGWRSTWRAHSASSAAGPYIQIYRANDLATSKGC